MLPSDAIHFYDIFDEFPEQFSQAQSYLEFCSLIGRDHLKSYVWAPPVFETAKAGKRTYHALTFPKASRFEDLFSAARFLPSPDKTNESRGLFYIGSPTHSAVPCGYIGGTRGYSKTTPDVRSHFGCKWYCTRVQPTLETMNAVRGYERSLSFGAIRRDDGVLIIAQDSSYIGGVWLALLDKDATIDGLFPESDRELIAKENQAAIDAWGEE